MEMMTRGRFRHVPVLDERQRLCGHDLDRRCGQDAHRRNRERSRFAARLYFRRRLGTAELPEASESGLGRNSRAALRVLWRECFHGASAMKFHDFWPSSGLALSAFLIAPAWRRQFLPAQTASVSMPTACRPPIPRRRNRPQTADLNSQVADANAAGRRQADSNAQYQSQQHAISAAAAAISEPAAAESGSAAEPGRSAVSRTAPRAYESLRARYAAERAAYHRGIWPDRYAHWRWIVNASRSDAASAWRSSTAIVSAR